MSVKRVCARRVKSTLRNVWQVLGTVSASNEDSLKMEKQNDALELIIIIRAAKRTDKNTST